MNRNSARLPISTSWPGVVSGVVGTGLIALFVTVHWSLAILAGGVIWALSAVEGEWFLLLVIFMLPVGWLLDTGTLVHDVMTAMRILVAAGFFLGLFWRRELAFRQLLRPNLSRWSLAFGAVVVLSATFGTGGWTHNSTRCLIVLASSILFYFVILAWANSRERVRRLLLVLLCSTIVASAFAIVQFVAGGYTSLWLYLYPPDDEFAEWSWRATSFLKNPNSLAGYLNLVLPFALAVCAVSAGTWKKVGAVCAVLGFVALALTQSRAGLVAFGCVLVAATFVFVKRLRNRLLFMGGLVLLALSFYFVGSVVSPDRFSADPVRPVLWITAWNLFVASPYWGTGLGNFTGLYGSYIHVPWIHPDYLTVNNLYLEVLSETGVVGFGIFYSLTVSAMLGGYSHFRRSRCNLSRIVGFGLFGAMITIFVHGVLDLTLEVSPQFDILLWSIFALFVADMKVQGKLGEAAFRV
jgi:O-antigen ligase